VGRGGFRLSLFGYDAESDYERITRELGGRRVHLGEPDASLILRKAGGQLPHGGGVRLPKSGPLYAAVRTWIAAGAPYGESARAVNRLEVTPEEALLAAKGRMQQVRVTARFSDGSSEDVTALALYTSQDDGVATVDAEGMATVLRPGLATIMVRYLGQVAAARVGMPFAAAAPAAAPASSNVIDAQVFPALQRLRLTPSPPSDDNEFLRRVYLDVIGTLPTAAEARSFLSDRDPAKRTKLIDELLARPEFVDYWTLKWADLLLINSKRLGAEPAAAYHHWLRAQVAANTPFDRVATTLIETGGDFRQDAPANFVRIASDPRDVAEFASRSLLGIRVECARCHNHPFDRWTQNDYYGFAAFFARTRAEGTRVVTLAQGEVDHPKTGRPVPPRALGAHAVAMPPAGDRRRSLAQWLKTDGAPMLARATANRVWKHLMGRGIIEPVDDVRVSNPPSNPALLDALTQELLRSGYDLRKLVRTIATSRTYQLASRPNDVNRADRQFFSHAYLKPLPAQVLADAVAQATGVPNDYPGLPTGTRAIQLVDSLIPSEALDVFGRCRREASCETDAQPGGGLSQALHLINGATLNDKLASGIVAKLVRDGATNGDAVDELYLRTLSRLPEPRERDHWSKSLAASTNRTESLEDLLWSLLNAREFAFNH